MFVLGMCVVLLFFLIGRFCFHDRLIRICLKCLVYYLDFSLLVNMCYEG